MACGSPQREVSPPVADVAASARPSPSDPDSGPTADWPLAWCVAALLATHLVADLTLHQAGLVPMGVVLAATAGRVVGGVTSLRAAPLRFPRWAGVVAALAVGLVSIPSLRGIDWSGTGAVGFRQVLGCVGLLGGIAPAYRWWAPNLRRWSLVVSLITLAAGVSLPGGSWVSWALVAWAAAATVVLVLEQRLDTRGARVLAADDSAELRRGSVLALRRGLVLLAVVVVVTPLLAQLIDPPQSGPTGSTRGGATEVGPASPLGSSDSMDTSLRMTPSDAVVLRVRADAPDFWRGAAFDRWNGRTWTATGTGSQPLATGGDAAYVSPELGAPAGGPGDVEAAEPQLHQTVTVVGTGMDLVVGARVMRTLYLPVGATEDPTDGSVTTVEPLRPGDVYSVVSRRPLVTEDALRKHDPRATGLEPAFADRFLQLPSVPDRVLALAREVTAASPTTYDAIRDLEAWMGNNLTYTLDIPPLPDGVDAVEQFLFVDRAGFCQQIASSLAVMLRSIGVPARVAVGFVPGDRDAVSGEYVVRASDAHAWVEVWFPGVGWQGFDPTANVPLSGEPGDSLLDRLLDVLRRLAPYLLGAATLLVAWVVSSRVRRAWLRRRSMTWAQVVSARLSRAGARRGRPRDPAETVQEYGSALVGSVLPDERLHAVTHAVTEATFAARPPAPDTAADVERQLREAERSHPPPRRWPGRRSRSPRRRS